MSTERIKLFAADIDTDGIVKKSVELKQEISTLRLEQEKLKSTVGETSEEFIKSEARLKKVSAEYRINQQQVSNLTADGGKLLTVQQKLTLALDKEIVSIDNAIDNNKELRKIRNSVNGETVDGQKAIEDLNKKIDENTKYIEKNTDSYSKQKMAIGDYKNQIKDAYKEMENEKKALEDSTKALVSLQEETEKGSEKWSYYNQQIQQNNTQINILVTSMGGVNDEMQATSTMSKLLSGDFKGLAADSEKAGGAGNLLMSSMKGAASGIWGATKASLAFLATPIGMVLGAIGLVLGAVIGYLKGTQEGIDSVTSVTRPLIEVLKTAKQIIDDIGGAFFKMLKGDIKGGFNDIKTSVKGMGDELGKAWERGKRLDAVLKGLDSINLKIAENESKHKDDLLEQNKIYRDRSKSAADRMKAAEEIYEIEQKQSKERQEALKLEVEILDIKLETSNLDEDKLARQKAYNALKDEERASDENQVGRLSRINNIRNQGLKEREDAQKEQKDASDKANEIAKKAIDEAIKIQEQKLQLLRGQRKFDEDNLEKVKFFADEELKVLKKKLDDKVITDLEYRIKKQDIDNAIREAEIADSDAVLERVKEFSDRKDQLENEIELRRLEVKSERDLLKAEQDFEKKVLELENLQLNEQEKTELLALMEIDRQQIIDGIKAEGMQKQLDDYKAFSDKEIAQRQSNANEVAAVASQLTSILSGLLGDSIGAKLASLAIDAAIQAGIVSTTTAASQATNLAQATTVGPPPVNVPFIAAAVAQNAIIQANSARAISKIIAGAAIKGIGTVAGSMRKAEHGIAIDIGGQRHSSGGTKFYGEDGTNFEAEKGEKMFILNRRASAALGPLLSDINMQYGGASLSTPASYLAAGGQVIRGNQAAAANNNIDFERMEEIMFRGTSRGSEVGSSRGSAKGTYSGMVDREDNIKIASGANF